MTRRIALLWRAVPSLQMNGNQPLTPDMVLRKTIRPVLVRAGGSAEGNRLAFFRNSLATNLRYMGVDVKIAQELLRHAHDHGPVHAAVSEDKRIAGNKQVELLLVA